MRAAIPAALPCWCKEDGRERPGAGGQEASFARALRCCAHVHGRLPGGFLGLLELSLGVAQDLHGFLRFGRQLGQQFLGFDDVGLLALVDLPGLLVVCRELVPPAAS